jgi:hypothetical protein
MHNDCNHEGLITNVFHDYNLETTIGKNDGTIRALSHVIQRALNDYKYTFFGNCMSQVLAKCYEHFRFMHLFTLFM